MKNRTILIVIFSSFLYSESCRKEDICACGKNNPQENIVWLKDRLQYYFCEDIYQYFYENKEFIAIETCPIGNDLYQEVFDCEGNLLCYRGGFGGDCPLPSDFWQTYNERKKLLFKHRSSI